MCVCVWSIYLFIHFSCPVYILVYVLKDQFEECVSLYLEQIIFIYPGLIVKNSLVHVL